jgi:hypothetical protein
MNGKGSNRRPTNEAAYCRNYTLVFSKRIEVPKPKIVKRKKKSSPVVEIHPSELPADKESMLRYKWKFPPRRYEA